MKSFPYHSNEDSFTLVELLVVIGILAILTAAVVIVLNPAELLKQSRDSKRTTDLASLNNAIKLLLTQNPDVNLGSASTVYVSLTDSSSICGSYALPSLPSGWQYHCAASADYQKTDGTGWVPVNFSGTGAASLPALPADPQNAGAYYYSYVAGGSWEITGLLESRKYSARARSDAGVDPERLEVGSNLTLWKDAYGIVGRWSLAQQDEKLGPELITNGDFSNGATGWSNGGYGDISIVTGNGFPGNALYSQRNAYNVARIVQMLSFVHSKTYRLSFSYRSSARFDINTNRSGGGVGIGTYEINTGNPINVAAYFTIGAATTDTQIGFQAMPLSSGDYIELGNVSLREVLAGDASANGGSGSVYGPAYAADQQGNANGAMSFNGTSNYVQLPDLDAYVTNGFTASYWIKKPNEGVGNRWVFGSYNGWTPGQSAFLLWTDDNTKGLKIQLQGVSTSPSACATDFTSYFDSWTFVAATYDKNSYKLYVNGSAACSRSFTESISSGSRTNWYIADTGSPTAGSIADVRLYSRALSAAEIQAIYNATK